MHVPLACMESECEDGSRNNLVNTVKNSENKLKKTAKKLSKVVISLFLAFFEGVLTKLFPNPSLPSDSIEAKETYHLSSPDKILL